MRQVQRLIVDPRDYAEEDGAPSLGASSSVLAHRERDVLWRVLAGAVALLLTVAGWATTRELGRIAESSAATAASVGRLDERMGRVLLDQAQLTARVSRVEEIARRAEQLSERCTR